MKIYHYICALKNTKLILFRNEVYYSIIIMFIYWTDLHKYIPIQENAKRNKNQNMMKLMIHSSLYSCKNVRCMLCFACFFLLNRKTVAQWPTDYFRIILYWVRGRQYKMHLLPTPFQPGKKVLCFGLFVCLVC